MAGQSYEFGENVKATVLNNSSGPKTLTLVIDLTHSGGPSASGKTIRVASTEGNVQVPGTGVTLGLNVYRPNK